MGLPETIKDAQGNVTTQTYNSFGNLVLTRDALGNETHLSLDGVVYILAGAFAGGRRGATAAKGAKGEEGGEGEQRRDLRGEVR